MSVKKRYPECVITGCDSKTEWQLNWFIENYGQNAHQPLIVADFGMSDQYLDYVTKHPRVNGVMNLRNTEDKGWFKPDYKWLNKYKTAQIDMLTEYVTGSVKVGTKKEKVQHLQNHLSMAPKFNPYGEWPQGE